MKLFATVFLIGSLIFVTSSFGQVTITQTDLLTNLVNSQRLNVQVRYFPYPTVNVGTPSMSTNQMFDFSSIVTGDTSRDSSVENWINPAGLPGADSFPTANVAQVMTDTSQPGITTQIYQYGLIADSGLYALGAVSHYSAPPLVDTTLISRFRPSSLLLPLPLTIGTQRSARPDTFDIELFPFFSRRMITQRSYTADAFGTITVPGGMASPGIRTIRRLNEWVYENGMLSDSSHSVDVVFFSQDLSQAEFDPIDSAVVSGNIQIEDVIFSRRLGPATSVRQESDVLPKDFSVSQNYPNPFNPTTTITFDIPEQSFVTLTVYSLLGNEVATLVSQQLAPGRYTATFDANAGDPIPSGIYFYKLTAGNFSQVKKMSLLK